MYSLVNVIPFGLDQIDHIKRLLLYISRWVENVRLITEKQIFLLVQSYIKCFVLKRQNLSYMIWCYFTSAEIKQKCHNLNWSIAPWKYTCKNIDVLIENWFYRIDSNRNKVIMESLFCAAITSSTFKLEN